MLSDLLGRWKDADGNLPLLAQARLLQGQLLASR
jgi:hypothetical protein